MKKEMQKKLDEWVEENSSRGFGDTIAKITKKMGMKPCRGCKDRQEKLNKTFPYRKKS